MTITDSPEEAATLIVNNYEENCRRAAAEGRGQTRPLRPPPQAALQELP
jgi:hypothetical protein